MNKIKRTALMALCIIVTLFSLSGCNNAIDSSSDSDGEAEQLTNLSNAAYTSRLFEQDILKIEITTSADDWSYLMENATSKPWISGDITINGETISNVGIKTKGNTSLTQISQTDSERYSLKISFGKYIDDQTCYGLDKLVLNNIYADSTYLKEYMSYNLFNYMDVPSSLCTFADIYVNGEHYGFYIALEDTDDSFFDRNYGEENEVEAYKPESMDMGGEGGMQNPNGNDNQGGNEGGFGGGKFDISSFISLTDKDGATVEWADITGDFDLSSIQSFTLEDGTVTSLSDIDMRSMQSLDFSKIVSFTDTSGKTLDLSEYTLSFAFPQNSGGNMQMPSSDDDSLQMPQTPDSTGDLAAMEPPDNITGGNDMQRPDNIGGGMGMNGGTGGVSLVYTDDSIESYNNIFDNSLTKTDEEDQNRLISSLKGISEGESLESYIDVDEVLRYTACNVFLMNLDSYFSSMGHNYILAENDGALSMIPWDYNLAFGTYQSSSSSDIINFGIDTVFSGIDAEDRPIIGKLLENEEYLEKYHEYLRQIIEEYVQSGLFEETITNAVSLIDEYVRNDSTSFNGYDAFVEGVEVLKEYGSLRAESIAGQLSGAIPSTSEAQKNSDALIDSSSLDLSKLGTMNMGGNFRDNTQLPDIHNQSDSGE